MEEVFGYICGDTTPEDSNSWQFLSLLYIGGVMKGEGETREQAKIELMNALARFYEVYNTDTLVLIRSAVNEPSWIYPWGKESRITFH